MSLGFIYTANLLNKEYFILELSIGGVGGYVGDSDTFGGHTPCGSPPGVNDG